MRCKVGDVALVVGSLADNLGRLVAICGSGVRFDGRAGWLVMCVAGRTLGGRNGFDSPIEQCRAVTFLDTHLRPIPGVRLGPEQSLQLLVSNFGDGSDVPPAVRIVEAGVGIEPA